MSTTNTEIAVIGGGIIGNSIAYHLAQQGRRVLVIERSGIASEPAASWASAGGVRRQGRHPAEARLAIEAIERWKTLEQELEADLHYRRGGNLLLAESDSEAAYLSTFVQQQRAMGFSDVRLVDRQEAAILLPGLNDQVVAGSFSPAMGRPPPRAPPAPSQLLHSVTVLPTGPEPLSSRYLLAGSGLQVRAPSAGRSWQNTWYLPPVPGAMNSRSA